MPLSQGPCPLSSIFKAGVVWSGPSHLISFLLPLLSLSSTFKDLCDFTGLIFIVQDNLPIKVQSLATFTAYAFWPNPLFHWLECGSLWAGGGHHSAYHSWPSVPQRRTSIPHFTIPPKSPLVISRKYLCKWGNRSVLLKVWLWRLFIPYM